MRSGSARPAQPACAATTRRWASRRGHRVLAGREDLLWGLLADGSSQSVQILRRHQVDIPRLRAGLQRWHQAAS
jgi:hypothetical protein